MCYVLYVGWKLVSSYLLNFEIFLIFVYLNSYIVLLMSFLIDFRIVGNDWFCMNVNCLLYVMFFILFLLLVYVLYVVFFCKKNLNLKGSLVEFNKWWSFYDILLI